MDRLKFLSFFPQSVPKKDKRRKKQQRRLPLWAKVLLVGIAMLIIVGLGAGLAVYFGFFSKSFVDIRETTSSFERLDTENKEM